MELFQPDKNSFISSHPQPNKLRIFKKFPKTFLGILILVTFLGLDFGLTALHGLLVHGTIHHRISPPLEIRIRSPHFHHDLKANTFKDASRGTTWGPLNPTYYTNSLGFRDKTIREIPLTSPNPRILLIGDSFTEGVGYDFPQTFAGILEAELSPKGIEILNAGVSSYSPAIYFKKIQYLIETVGLQFDQVVVFIDISDIPDEIKNYNFRNGETLMTTDEPNPFRTFIDHYSTVLRSLFKFGSYLIKISNPEYRHAPYIPRSAEDEKYGLKKERSLWTIHDEMYKAIGEKGIEKALTHMNQLANLLHSHNIELTIAVYPWPDQIFSKDLDSIQVQIWKDWARNHESQFINFFPDFIKPEQDPKKTISQFFIEGDTHWNAQGHQLIANRLLKELKVELLNQAPRDENP